MAVHGGGARWFYENMVDSGHNTIPWKQLSDFATAAAATAVCIATTNFRWEGISIVCERCLSHKSDLLRPLTL